MRKGAEQHLVVLMGLQPQGQAAAGAGTGWQGAGKFSLGPGHQDLVVGLVLGAGVLDEHPLANARPNSQRRDGGDGVEPFVRVTHALGFVPEASRQRVPRRLGEPVAAERCQATRRRARVRPCPRLGRAGDPDRRWAGQRRPGGAAAGGRHQSASWRGE